MTEDLEIDVEQWLSGDQPEHVQEMLQCIQDVP